MSLDPKVSNNQQTRFTYEPFTWKTFVNLIGVENHRFCEIMAPRECRGSRNIPKECDEIFWKCLKVAEREEAFSRLN